VQFVDTIAHHIISSPEFGSWPLHVDFVVKIKVALGQVYLQVLRIAPIKIITTLLHTHIGPKVVPGQVYLPVLRIAPVKIIITLLHTHILSKSDTEAGLSPSTLDCPCQNHYNSAPYAYFIQKWCRGRFISQHIDCPHKNHYNSAPYSYFV